MTHFTGPTDVDVSLPYVTHKIDTNLTTGAVTDAIIDSNGRYSWSVDKRPKSVHSGFWPGTLFRLCAPYTRYFEATTAKASGARFRSGNFETFYPGLGLWATGSTLHSVPVPTLAEAGLVNKALVKALNRLKDQEIHLGNFLAEGHQVVEMIGDTARNIAKSVQYFRKHDDVQWQLVQEFQKGNLARDLWRCIPNSWLQLQYGWTPLMSDLEGAMNHLARLSLTQKPLVFTKGTAKIEEDVTAPLVARSPYSQNSGHTTWEQKRVASVQLVYGVNSPALIQASQLGLVNPLEIVWEVTRYSFVVDWFLPIGSWMSALTADLGYNFVTGSLSRITKSRYKSSILTKRSADAVSVEAPSFEGARTMNFARSCYTTSPVPGLYVKSPISLKHALNGISLLVQAFR